MTDWKMHEYKLTNETDPPKKIDGTDMKVWKCARMCACEASWERSICGDTFVDFIYCEPEQKNL